MRAGRPNADLVLSDEERSQVKAFGLASTRGAQA
jgi:hypothetical protein